LLRLSALGELAIWPVTVGWNAAPIHNAAAYGRLKVTRKHDRTAECTLL
jgi:hypothetical protein